MARRTIAHRPPHARSCRHCHRVRLLGRDFRSWRESWDLRCEAVAVGYAAESAEFAADNPAPTFKQYLIQMAGTGWPMSGQQPQRRRFAA